jgi:hypothetical protein
MLHGLDDPNVGIRRAISEWPGDNGNGPCLSVLDDADDREILFESSAPMSAEQQGRQLLAVLAERFPRISNGSMLITTRDNRSKKRLANRGKPVKVLPFNLGDTRNLLRYKLPDNTDWNEAQCIGFLGLLYHLPLAIAQAAAYICEEDVSVVRLLRDEDTDTQAFLEQSYSGPRRDSETQNSIFLTWNHATGSLGKCHGQLIRYL